MLKTEEKMEMKPEMTNKNLRGKVSANTEDARQCAVISILRNQKIVLEEDLDDATKKLGEATLDKENWVAKYECEMKCNVIKGQIAIVSKLQREFENMMPLVTI